MTKTTPQSHGLFESCVASFLRIRDRRNSRNTGGVTAAHNFIKRVICVSGIMVNINAFQESLALARIKNQSF